MIEIMIVTSIIGIVVAIATPGWMKQRNLAQQRHCQENLKKMDEAKEQWAIENRKSPSDTPEFGDIYEAGGASYLKTEPKCPAQGTYSINSLGSDATCTITAPLDHNAKSGDEA